MDSNRAITSETKRRPAMPLHRAAHQAARLYAAHAVRPVSDRSEADTQDGNAALMTRPHADPARHSLTGIGCASGCTASKVRYAC